ncbi:MAG TPA: aminotransferase class I/II-fold pyridoxal phosphate-dependent enzyme [Candidatus Polarisedimenticolia bacterium]|nr:aminotransferase class I/II-fold pyridoxal phosphate-dependent enzyme [Candidatus Polarisedimenticolia bacterium]
MRIEPFRMERMQSTYENYVDYNLSESGVHPMRASELLELGGGAAERFLGTELGYCQSNGTEELRDRIAAFYDGAKRANILVTNGGSEANYATLWSLLERGDRVAFMLPNYLQAWGLSRAFAGRADAFRLVPRRDGGTMRWALDVDGLRRAVTKKTRAIVITNPNNPTGGILTDAEMDEVVRAARRSGAWILADEIYRGAEVSGRTAPSFWGRHERVLITSGLSKAFGLPGLRIGWVAGPAAAVGRIWSYRDYTTIAPGILSDYLGRLAMDPKRREAIFSRTRAIIRRNLPVIEKWLRAHDDVFGYIQPQAGAIVFARYALPIGSVALVERLRTSRSVLVCAGDQFGTGRHLRFGFGSDADYMMRGLERVGETLAELRKGRPRRAEPAERQPRRRAVVGAR